MQHRSTITVPNPDIWAERIHRSNVAQEVFKRRLDAEAIIEWGEMPKYELPKTFYPKQERVSWFELLSNIDYKRFLNSFRP